MSGFSEEIMRERLQRLTNTAPSIQTLSLWLIHHQKKHANVILETWLKEVKGHNSTERLIALTNLANDVIQNCRKKSPQFMKIFLDVLQPGFSFEAVNFCAKKRHLWEALFSRRSPNKSSKPIHWNNTKNDFSVSNQAIYLGERQWSSRNGKGKNANGVFRHKS